MVIEDLIDINDKPSVMRSLLLRHRHVNEHQGVLPFTKRKYNSYTSLQVSSLSRYYPHPSPGLANTCTTHNNHRACSL